MMELAANEDDCVRNRTALMVKPPTPVPSTQAPMVNVALEVRRTMASALNVGMMVALMEKEDV